jgi:hypothetical protein
MDFFRSFLEKNKNKPVALRIIDALKGLGNTPGSGKMVIPLLTDLALDPMVKEGTNLSAVAALGGLPEDAITIQALREVAKKSQISFVVTMAKTLTDQAEKQGTVPKSSP